MILERSDSHLNMVLMRSPNVFAIFTVHFSRVLPEIHVQRERDFGYFCPISKNSNIGVTSEVNPVKFRGFGRSVLVLSRGASGLGVGVGTQNGAVSFFSILVFQRFCTWF